MASRCGADLELDHLPVRGPLSGMADADRWRIQLAGGDDYELCFTLPPDLGRSIKELVTDSGTELTVVGHISDRPGVRCRTPAGGIFDAGPAGYEHFA